MHMCFDFHHYRRRVNLECRRRHYWLSRSNKYPWWDSTSNDSWAWCHVTERHLKLTSRLLQMPYLRHDCSHSIVRENTPWDLSSSLSDSFWNCLPSRTKLDFWRWMARKTRIHWFNKRCMRLHHRRSQWLRWNFNARWSSRSLQRLQRRDRITH